MHRNESVNQIYHFKFYESEFNKNEIATTFKQDVYSRNWGVYARYSKKCVTANHESVYETEMLAITDTLL